MKKLLLALAVLATAGQISPLLGLRSDRYDDDYYDRHEGVIERTFKKPGRVIGGEDRSRIQKKRNLRPNGKYDDRQYRRYRIADLEETI